MNIRVALLVRRSPQWFPPPRTTTDPGTTAEFCASIAGCDAFDSSPCRTSWLPPHKIPVETSCRRVELPREVATPRARFSCHPQR